MSTEQHMSRPIVPRIAEATPRRFEDAQTYAESNGFRPQTASATWKLLARQAVLAGCNATDNDAHTYDDLFPDYKDCGFVADFIIETARLASLEWQSRTYDSGMAGLGHSTVRLLVSYSNNNLQADPPVVLPSRSLPSRSYKTL